MLVLPGLALDVLGNPEREGGEEKLCVEGGWSRN